MKEKDVQPIRSREKIEEGAPKTIAKTTFIKVQFTELLIKIED